MLLKKFTAKNIHGFLDFNIAFDKKLTFITGQNGGGKTTLVNAIVALISPNLEVLANIEFDTMSLSFSHDGGNYVVSAFREKNLLRLQINNGADSLDVPIFVLDPDEPPYKQLELEREYYSKFLTSNSENPVLKAIGHLPVPMFLDIDRRSRAGAEISRQTFAASRFRQRARNVFSAFLFQSLTEAAFLVEERYRQFLITDRVNAEKLRQDLVLSLFNMEDKNEVFELRLPSKEDKQLIESLKDLQRSLPDLIGIESAVIKSKIGPYLSKVEKLVKKFPEHKALEDYISSGAKDMSNVINWVGYLQTLQRFSQTIELVKNYGIRRDEAKRSFDAFVELANKFLVSGLKKLEIDRQGAIVFGISGREGARPITTLSSGEAQIFVILSHLFFNPAAQKANVFIVDEPELSLHVSWQEIFVDAIQSANPQVQYILATHSPSIIAGKLEHCRDKFATPGKV